MCLGGGVRAAGRLEGVGDTSSIGVCIMIIHHVGTSTGEGKSISIYRSLPLALSSCRA